MNIEIYVHFLIIINELQKYLPDLRMMPLSIRLNTPFCMCVPFFEIKIIYTHTLEFTVACLNQPKLIARFVQLLFETRMNEL